VNIIEHLPFNTKTVIGNRAKIGVVVLSTDYTLEHEFRQILTVPGIDFYCARIGNSNTVTPETLAAMKSKIQETLSLILPEEKLDVVAYGSTSATTVLGEQTIFDEIKKVQPEALFTTPITAAFAAFSALSIKRVAVLTPYRRDVNEAVADCIAKAGYEIPVFGSFNEDQDPVVATIDTDSIAAAARRLVAQADVDAVFISCTSVRFVDAIDALETELGLPVITSNHAMAWHCLRLSGDTSSHAGLGSLYRHQLTDTV